MGPERRELFFQSHIVIATMTCSATLIEQTVSRDSGWQEAKVSQVSATNISGIDVVGD